MRRGRGRCCRRRDSRPTRRPGRRRRRRRGRLGGAARCSRWLDGSAALRAAPSALQFCRGVRRVGCRWAARITRRLCVAGSGVGGSVRKRSGRKWRRRWRRGIGERRRKVSGRQLVVDEPATSATHDALCRRARRTGDADGGPFATLRLGRAAGARRSLLRRRAGESVVCGAAGEGSYAVPIERPVGARAARAKRARAARRRRRPTRSLGVGGRAASARGDVVGLGAYHAAPR
mmetsp:Transcript_11294/g.36971  ORF Transcript_11294/g.36971 Transcript_11294/m.36971 type:complete len:233 (-) Transcript_11294:1017-1715(-)